MDPRRVELVDRYADMIQIGARNMQNFVLLTEVGQTNKPVLLKRGMSATIDDLLMSAEYILSQGNPERRAVRARREGLRPGHAQPVRRGGGAGRARGCRTCRSSSIPAMPRAGPT